MICLLRLMNLPHSGATSAAIVNLRRFFMLIVKKACMFFLTVVREKIDSRADQYESAGVTEMTAKLSLGMLLSVGLLLLVLPAVVSADTMDNYCQAPAFVNAVPAPNMMLAIDVSGSMGWTAYRSVDNTRQHSCSNNSTFPCNPDHDFWNDGQQHSDCIKNYGICETHDGEKRCSNHHDSHCDTDADCLNYNYGLCTGAGTSDYGSCKNSSPVQACDALNADTACGVNVPCVPSIVHEGYFNPSSTYALNADGIYYEVAGTVCPIKYTYKCYSTSNPVNKCTPNTRTRPADALNSCGTAAYCTSQKGIPTSTTCSGADKGDWLNYTYMSRIDLLRWALTGGAPSACGEANTGIGTAANCDPRVNTVSCSTNLKLSNDGSIPNGKGCVLKSHGIDSNNGISAPSIQVAVPWTGRLEDGLAFQFSLMPVKPRMGLYTFSGSSVRNYVYLGDFTAASQTNDTYYSRLLSAVNYSQPSGSTPTGPAMRDILDYYKQVAPTNTGGINAVPNTTTNPGYANWMSPMYDCNSSTVPTPALPRRCSLASCAKNFVLLMSDGEWNQGEDPVKPAREMHIGYTNAVTNAMTKVEQVYTVGMFVSAQGQNSLKNVAVYGSFDYDNATAAASRWPAPATGYPSSSLTVAPPYQPDTYYVADDALTMRSNIQDAVYGMLARTSSGTAASVLASGEGSGANIIQSIFYPRRNFFPTEPSIAWTSTLQNLWYYLDPKTANSTIRENTTDTGATPELKLNQDYIVNFWFDAQHCSTATTTPCVTSADCPSGQTCVAGTNETKAKLYADANGDGLADTPATPTSIVDSSDIKFIWEAGTMLWNRDASTRTIYTNLANTATMPEFKATNLSTTTPTLQSLLNIDGLISSAGQRSVFAGDLISYIRGSAVDTTSYGTDTITFRNRTTAVDLDNNGNILGAGESAKVWKLGDIINSTPRIASWIPLNQYDKSYSDSTYTEFVTTAAYKARGTVFTGANDGMLHAFKLGTLALFKDQFKKAEMQGTNLGEESWAFIPKNALPYLQYLIREDYCHLYYVDATPVLFDASIGTTSCAATNYWDCPRTVSTWRTVLVGGMRQGGACKAAATANGVAVPAAGLGYSSYFALDVTDPVNPKLLWEFAPTDGSLGLATTGPAIMRISARNFTATTSTPDQSKNGRWFAVFASGPTGPVDSVFRQFKGHSDQNLKLFVVDLAGPGSGNSWTLNTNYWVKDTLIPNAFGGSLSNGNVDYDLDYQDDVLYLGYTKSEVATPTATTQWNDGGILRYVTRENLAGNAIAGTALNPANWELSTVRDGLGPITASVAHLAHYAAKYATPDKAYLYAGAGRYFFNTTEGVDDSDTVRKLYGLTEPCLTSILSNISCSTSNTGTLEDVSSNASPVLNTNGWYITLDASTSTSGSERLITDPLASSMGAVFLTSFKPKKDACSFGGSTYLWAVKYDTGGTAAGSLKGKGLIQVSTGAIEQVDLATAFVDRNTRRSAALTGVPPLGQGLSIVVPPNPVDTMLHIRKK